MNSGGRLGVKQQCFGGPFSERLSFQQEAMGVVDEPIQHSVGNGWIADHLVPVIDRHLSSRSRRCSPVSGVRPQSSRINNCTRPRVFSSRP